MDLIYTCLSCTVLNRFLRLTAAKTTWVYNAGRCVLLCTDCGAVAYWLERQTLKRTGVRAVSKLGQVCSPRVHLLYG